MTATTPDRTLLTRSLRQQTGRRDAGCAAYDRLARLASRLRLHPLERWAHRRWLRRTMRLMSRRWFL